MYTCVWASVAVCGSLLCMRRVYLLLLLRTHYVFTDVRTTYLPMHVLLLLLIYRCTYYTLTDFTYYYYVPMYLLLLTELGACPRRSPSDSSSRRGPLRACPGLEVGVRGWGLGVGD